MQVLIFVLLGFHVLVSLLMVFIVLMQRPRSEGLGAAFGGGMTENIFGARDDHGFDESYRVAGRSLFVLTLALAMLYAKQSSGTTKLSKELSQMPAHPPWRPRLRAPWLPRHPPCPAPGA